jgi:hypothetical protein
MKKRFSEEQIILILKEADTGQQDRFYFTFREFN